MAATTPHPLAASASIPSDMQRRSDRPAGAHVGSRRAVAQFAVGGFAALILLSAVGVYTLRRVGQSEAIRDAKHITVLSARVIEPSIGSGLATGDPAAVARVDHVVKPAMLTGGIVRVKIWRADGRIVYSDEHRLIGSTYRLGHDELAALASGKADAEVSDLARPENRFERRYHKLLEVYLPIRDPAGRRLLFETYQRYSSVSASGRRLWLEFLPGIIGALALLELVQLPLAVRLTRRLRRGVEERETLLRRAIEASDLERRRIARDLHDGAVQDLAGVSYTLAAAADNADAQPAAAMREAAATTRRTIKALRSLLVEIYPPDLHRTGLEAALRDLLAPLESRGIATTLDYPPGFVLPPEPETLFFRSAQEALRNVATHSGAAHVVVRVENVDGLVRLCVEDDGRGFTGEVAEGHLGLRLLGDLAADAGGRFAVDSMPGGGTLICVEVPL